MKTNCPQRSRTIDFVNGELGRLESGRFAEHLGACPSCRGEVDAVRRVIDGLKALPERPCRDLSAQVLAAARQSAQTAAARSYWKPALATAAALALAVGIASRPSSPHSEKVVASVPAHPQDEGIRRAVDWLKARQQEDGSWNAARWGGHQGLQVALTALPTIAILNTSESPDESADKALAWLLRQQHADGCFGARGMGLPFNHPLATLALLKAAEKRMDEDLNSRIEAALATILRSQVADGGWGHYGSDLSHPAVTAWHVRTLEEAVDLGWDQAAPALERVRAATARGALAADFRDSPADVGKLPDFYESYFLARHLSGSEDPGSRIRLDAIRRHLMEAQVGDGEDSGSWPPDVVGGHVGGRLYATALASLALNDR
jgi:hypothetical protein